MVQQWYKQKAAESMLPVARLSDVCQTCGVHHLELVCGRFKSNFARRPDKYMRKNNGELEIFLFCPSCLNTRTINPSAEFEPLRSHIVSTTSLAKLAWGPEAEQVAKKAGQLQTLKLVLGVLAIPLLIALLKGFMILMVLCAVPLFLSVFYGAKRNFESAENALLSNLGPETTISAHSVAD